MGYRKGKSGIYTITNIVNGKIYVGYSVNIPNRLNKHLKHLKLNKHPNEYLQRSFNKYKEESFLFEELVECSKTLLPAEEHYWATILNVHNRDFGYNIEPTHPNHLSIISEYTRAKISKAVKGKNIGKKQTEEHKRKGALARTGRKATQEHKDNISKGLKGRKLSKEHISKFSIKMKGRKLTEEHKEKCKLNSATRKSVTQYDQNGKFIKDWLSIKEASLVLGISRGNIRSICNGRIFKRKRKDRFIWKYKE